jgi:hypothetical protein
MKRITAKEFYAMTDENPSVFEHWNTPLEITEYTFCTESPITHLSKHLIFSGRNESGEAAEFKFCSNLKTATGTFQGYVTFAKSNIESIIELHVTKARHGDNWAANFHNCPNLQIATGTYAGFVAFAGSNIKSIHNLHIQSGDDENYYADFIRCSNLQNLEGWNLSKKIWIEEEKLQAERKRRAALQNFVKENKPQELPFL